MIPARIISPRMMPPRAMPPRAMLPRIVLARSRRAFTFVEIMMTVFMLCVCILPLMGYIHSTTRATGHTQDRSLAMTLVGQMMERYRGLSYDDLNTKCGTTPLSETDLATDNLLKLDNFAPDLRKRMEADKYVRSVTFKDIPDPRVTGPAAATAKVGLLTVSVEWTPLNLPSSKMILCKIVPAFTN